MTLAEACYQLTRDFPREELFGLTSQLRRAASPIAANIAEGYGRESTGSFVQSLRVAQGSLKECETHLLLAGRVGIVSEEKVKPMLDQCDGLGRMLRAFIRSLQQKGAMK